MAAARLRALRTHLLPLHQAILDHERRQYERLHGKIGSPHTTLQLVLHDPFFAWVRPLASLIVQIDERLAAEAPIQPSEVDAFGEQTRALLQRDLAGGDFREQYQRVLQSSTDVVIAHGQVLSMVPVQRTGN